MTTAHKKHRSVKKAKLEKKSENVLPEKPEFKTDSNIVQPQQVQPANVVVQPEPFTQPTAPVAPTAPEPIVPPVGQNSAIPTAPTNPTTTTNPTASTVQQNPAVLNPLTDFKEKMSEEEKLPSFSSPKKNFMWPILFIFVLAILLLGGVFFYKYGASIKDRVNLGTTPSPSLSPVITAEPTKTVDLSQYEIEILNGSEVNGEASRQKTALETEGFVISSVGNADNSDYKDTIIKAKKTVNKDFVAKLKDALSSSFTLGEVETLPEDAATPVVVIIGVEK